MGSVTGDYSVGGLVGYNRAPITDCYATGAVTGGGWVGGLAGYNIGPITDSYATGAVTGDWYVGGLVGLNGDDGNPGGTITSCYATGAVIGNSYIGGLVGYSYFGTTTACFWDIETSGISTSAGGTGKTTAEMMTKATFTDAGWDFVNVWTICEGTDYPRLTWEVFGTLQVTIQPPQAVAAGGQWRLFGTSYWYDSGQVVEVRIGYHSVEFKAVSGWSRPCSIRVLVRKKRIPGWSGHHNCR